MLPVAHIPNFFSPPSYLPLFLLSFCL
jgi:hypothetical protein